MATTRLGASYGPALLAQTQANQLGHRHMLWLFHKDCHVTEAGARNFFIDCKRKDLKGLEPVTSSLDIVVALDEITCRSILELARARLELQVIEIELWCWLAVCLFFIFVRYGMKLSKSTFLLLQWMTPARHLYQCIYIRLSRR